MGRKLYAKLQLDEQKLYTRRRQVGRAGKKTTNPIVIRNVSAYMQSVDGVKVTCLTLGGLRSLPLAGNIERCCIEA